MTQATRSRIRRGLRRLRRTGPAAPSRWTQVRPLSFPPEQPGPDDGGAGVREPRRPLPGQPPGAMELPLPTGEQEPARG